MKSARWDAGSYHEGWASHRSRAMLFFTSALTLTWPPVSTVMMLLSQ